MKMIPNLKLTVGFLYYRSDGHHIPLGTGSFAMEREGEHIFEYLITCKHVVEACPRGSQMYVRLNRSDKKDVKYIPLDNGWIYHSDKAVDLAVTHFSPPKDVPCDYEAVDVNFVFLPDDYLNNYISEGDPVAFIGLFTKVTGKRRNFPIYRYGHVAMVTDEKIHNKKYGAAHYLLVECDAYPGNSGAPLYVAIPQPIETDPGRHIVFILGIMTASYLEQEIWVAGEKKITTHNSRITLVVPINYVRDILRGDALVSVRKKRIQESKSPDDNPVFMSASHNEVKRNPFERDDFPDIL